MLTEAVSYDPFFLKEGMQNKDEIWKAGNKSKNVKQDFLGVSVGVKLYVMTE